jgi:hypothetical protein
MHKTDQPICSSSLAAPAQALRPHGHHGIATTDTPGSRAAMTFLHALTRLRRRHVAAHAALLDLLIPAEPRAPLAA